jgi:hypothetical protein
MTIYDPPRGKPPTVGLAVDAGRRGISEVAGIREVGTSRLGTESQNSQKGYRSGIPRSRINLMTNPQPGKSAFDANADLGVLTRTT